MSTLWIAHIRLREGQPDEQVPCDAAHVNDQGYLALTVHTYVGAIACYAPGVWDGYTLEAAPQPVTEEQLMSGEKSLNDYRRSLCNPAPDTLSPTTLTINVAGSVLAERDLRRIVDEQIVQHIKNTSGYYGRAFRR